VIEWKEIIGFEDYAVSSEGTIYILKRLDEDERNVFSKKT
jgi:hypothetical protein